MANTGTQASQIRDLLVERLEAYDPTLDLSENGSIYGQVVAPVFEALSIDPFDTDIEDFLITRLRQEFPSISAQNGDAIVDIVVRPLQLMLEAFKREIQIIRTGQSVRNAEQMRTVDAEDLAANFFVTRKTGSRATGTVRIFFANPTFVSILADVRFDAGGLGFFPITPQFFRPEIVAAQRSGQLYYVDIGVIAEDVGDAFNIEPEQISTVSGIGSAIRVTNLVGFSNGSDEETGPELLARTQTALTERSLNTRRGIRARLFSEFPGIRNIEVVGFGDPEMQRDKITGAGGSDVICSGMSFILGRYMFLLSMFENKGRDGNRRIRDGGSIDLNFWQFLYGTQAIAENQRFTVEEVLYESSGDLEGIPTIYLLRLNQAPEVDAPPGAMIPGLLPAVFASAYDRAEIRISGIPGGITNPDDADEIVVRDDQVHIGGHYDVFVRPSQSSSTSSVLSSASSEVSVLEGTTLCTISKDEIPATLKEYGALENKVNARLRLTFSRSSVPVFIEGEVIRLYNSSTATKEMDTGAIAVDVNNTDQYIDLVGNTRDNEWTQYTEIIGESSGAIGTITSVEQTLWADYGVTRGMTLTIIDSPDSGTYKIMDVQGPELVLDSAMTVLGSDYRFRVVDEVVVDAFEPRAPLYPFAGQAANDLDMVIGSATVRTSVDLISYGATEGATIEVLDGPNVGVYEITGFDAALRGRAPILDTVMPSTDANASFRLFAAGSGLSRPLVRVSPQGMVVQDAQGQSTGYAVPPALPVGARAVESFSGARESYRGLNGFVMPDAGQNWAPTSHVRLVAYDVDSATGAVSNGSGLRSPDGTILQADMKTITQYSGRPGTCITDECLPSDDDYVAVITLAQDASGTSGHALQNHLSINLPTEVTDFLGEIRSWLTSLTEDFGLGDDFRSFFDLFAPFTLDPIDASHSIIAQYEILIPKALFDNCNNTFIAAPEFDWKGAFSDETTFVRAMEDYNNGELRNTPAALSRAKSGDILTVSHGANAGSYVIDKVYTYKLYHGGSIVTADSSSGTPDYLDDRVAYTFAIVKIKNEFPVNPYQGLSDFFPASTSSGGLSLSGPTFNVSASVSTGPTAGDTVNPWEIVQESFTWLFKTLDSAGYTVPSELVVSPESVLKKITAGFFDDYVVGSPTAEQIARLYFTEPTSVTAYGPSACLGYSWNEEVTEAASITGAVVTLPLTSAAGKTLTCIIEKGLSRETLTATVSAEISETTDIEELQTLLQDALDTSEGRVLVTVTGVQTSRISAFGGLPIPSVTVTLTSVVQGEGTYLSAVAGDAEDGFRHLGFTDDGIPFYEAYLNLGSAAYAVDSLDRTQTEFRATVTVLLGSATFAGSVGTIGNPSIGDTVTQGSTNATIRGVIYSTADGVVTLLVDATLNTADAVTINGTAVSAPSSVSAASTFTEIDIAGATAEGGAPPTGTTHVDPQIDDPTQWASSPALLLADLSEATPTSIYAGLGGLSGTEITEFIKKCVIDRFVGGLTSYPSFEFSEIGSTVFGTFDFSLSFEAVDSATGIDLSMTLTPGDSGFLQSIEFARSTGSSNGNWVTTGSTATLNASSTAATFDSVNYADLELSGSSTSGTTTISWGGVPGTKEEATSLYSAASYVTPSHGILDHHVICRELNALEFVRVGSGGNDVVQFFVPETIPPGTAITVGGSATVAVRYLSPLDSATLAAPLVGVASLSAVAPTLQRFFEIESVDYGTSSPGELQERMHHPHAPTLLSVPSGAEELLFTATATELPQQVFPGATREGRTLPNELPRDSALGAHYAEATAFKVLPSDPLLPSFLTGGVRAGSDFLHVYEQRRLLETATTGSESVPAKQDRVVAVTMQVGSSVLRIPSLNYGSSEFSFLSPSSDLDTDTVRPGDYVFIEEGDGASGYRITEVGDTYISIDSPMPITTRHIYRSGNEGSIEETDTFTDLNAPFIQDDVGRYLTMYLSDYPGVDGSYQILSVSSDGATVTLDRDAFPVTETGIHWSVVKAPIDEVEESSIDGGSELVGVRPIRIYSGVPSQWRVVYVHASTERSSSYLLCAYDGGMLKTPYEQQRNLETYGPIRGYKQPYEVVRPHVVHMSSTEMKAQGTENGLYYMDLRAQSLGGRPVYNLPKDTILTPVFGTYESDGYRMQVVDPLYSYSAAEQCKIYFSPSFLPDDLDDTLENRIPLNGAGFLVTHEFSSDVGRVQALLSSNLNRILCADPLARHFLPSFVYLDISATGGNRAKMALEIANYINGLEPEDVLDVSELEKFLHSNNVGSYRHPIILQIVTHDLDRRRVLTRSTDRIGNVENDFNGSHRTTFYIPGTPVTTDTAGIGQERILVSSEVNNG
jgi:hypothetical protein